jgi:hypothetical protein
MSLAPTIGVLVSSLHTGAFRETAPLAAFAVSGDATNATFASPYALISLSQDYPTGDVSGVKPEIQFGYRSNGGVDGTYLTLAAVTA